MNLSSIVLAMLGDIFNWWWDILRPFLLRGKAQTEVSSRIVVRRDRIELFDGDEVAVLLPEGEEAQSRFAAKVRAMPAAPRVDLESGRYVLRRLSPVRLPLSRARTMASLDLTASTPFAPADVLTLQVRSAAPTQAHATAYVIVKRSVLAPVLSILRSAGKPAGAIGLLGPGDGESQEWIVDPAETRTLAGPPRIAGRPLKIAASVVAIALVATFGHAQWRLSTAQARVDERLPELEMGARKVRDELNRRSARVAEITALRKSLVTQRSMSELLEEISRVLPDTAYLTNLTVREGKATLIGFSESASAIIAPLETSAMFEGAEFISPVTKAAGREDERFEIRANVVNR